MNDQVNVVRQKHEEKLAWLRKLSEFNPKNELKVATTIDGRRIGRWIPFCDWSDVGYIDHATVLPNEVIWEIDHDNWDFIRKYARGLLTALDRFEVPHVQGPTSGRGFHIHSYFILPEHSIRKELNDYGVLPRDLRIALFGMICREARIPATMIGKGLPFDTGCLDFSDMSMGHMVRTFGGRKFENGYVIGHKSFMAEVPKERTRLTKFTEVRIPERIVPYPVPKTIIEGLLVQMEAKKRQALRKHSTVSDGLYLDAPCVRALIADGRQKGDRNRGAQVVAIACRLSGLCYEAALEAGEEYYSHCDKGDFSFYEIEGWMKWAYSRELDWRCSQAIPFRRCQPHICPVARENFTDKPKGTTANPVWLRKWQKPLTVGWAERRKRN